MQNTYDTPTYTGIRNIYPGDYCKHFMMNLSIKTKGNFQKEKKFLIFVILEQDQKKIF